MIAKSCYKLCLNIKTLNHEDSFLYIALMYSVVYSSEMLLTHCVWCWGTSAFLIGYRQLCSLAGVSFWTMKMTFP
jgi:hypothetical protein